jgi:hypothetical protein
MNTQGIWLYNEGKKIAWIPAAMHFTIEEGVTPDAQRSNQASRRPIRPAPTY